MANTITVTTCNDEIIFYLYNCYGSYKFFHLRGAFSDQTVTLTITPGQYQTGIEYYADSGPCNFTIYVNPGAYYISMVGINWGLTTPNFIGSINSYSFNSGELPNVIGVAYSLQNDPVSITV